MAGPLETLAHFDAGLRAKGFKRTGSAWERALADVTWRVAIDRGTHSTTVFNLDPSVVVHGARDEWVSAGPELAEGPTSLRFIDDPSTSHRFTRWREVVGRNEGVLEEFERDVQPWLEAVQTSTDVLALCRSRSAWQAVLVGGALAKRVGDETALTDLLEKAAPSWEAAASSVYLRHLRGEPAPAVDEERTALLQWYRDNRRAVARSGFQSADLETRLRPGSPIALIRASAFPQDRGFSWPGGVDELEIVHERKTFMSRLTFGLYSRIDGEVVDAVAAQSALAALIASDEVRGRTVYRVAAENTPEAIRRLRALPRSASSALLS